MQIIHQVNEFLTTIFPDSIITNKKDYIISSVSNKRYTGNQVFAYLYVSWALAIPDQVQHLGLDYGKEFELAKNMI
ncbi:hypothetical protein [Yeosuana sp.]|uniref:hypothetical protein n=1 Tax=Yeosuana sp. TaxID=2529388 RepID=UPI0040494105